MADEEFEEEEGEEGEEEEAYQEATGEEQVPRLLKKSTEQSVFCPNCDEYMPFSVKPGSVVVKRRCPQCGYEKEAW